MTEVIAADGSKQETNLPAEAVADLQATPAESVVEPAKVVEPQIPPVEAPKTDAPKVDPPKVETPPDGQPREDNGQFRPKKATPIQNLLNQRHDLETALADRDQKLADLETKLQALSQKPNNAATGDDVIALAEELGADPAVLQRIVDLARKGFQPAVPKELQDLVAKQKITEQEQAEQAAFKQDVTRLGTTLKDDLLKKPEVLEKLQELAYSDAKAPDGEQYFKKPLYELYMNFVKPEFEPGQPSGEPSRGGSKASGTVTDFADIKADPAKLEDFVAHATAEQFEKYQKWDRETSGDLPLRKPLKV